MTSHLGVGNISVSTHLFLWAVKVSEKALLIKDYYRIL